MADQALARAQMVAARVFKTDHFSIALNMPIKAFRISRQPVISLRSYIYQCSTIGVLLLNVYAPVWTKN